MENHNQKILGLSMDGKGLLVNTKTCRDTYWHVHSVELTPYQKKIRDKLSLKWTTEMGINVLIKKIKNCKNGK